MKRIQIYINGKKIDAPRGEKLLWVAIDNGIYIPNLCGLRENSEPLSACRLCWVEIEGKDKPVSACNEIVTDGMKVNTRGDKALSLARRGFELLMASHALDCTHCLKNRKCELQKIASYLKVSLKSRSLPVILRDLPIDTSHPLFVYNPNKCVICGRCVWVCRNRLHSGTLGFSHRGFQRRVTVFGDLPMETSDCTDCQECIEVCPTGALILKQ
jgi:bidirectional [NiFe] hydrogenase diaphorase subunit